MNVMQRYVLLLTAWCSSLLMVAQGLSARIDVLLGDALLHAADASVVVYDLTADTMLYEHRADKLCRPASVEKVVTAVAALDRLGTDYTLHTTLRAHGTVDADSILHGDLYVIGGFDPEFSSADLDELVAAIPRAGIRSVTGRVVADVSIADTTYWGNGWCWDDAPASFQPYYSPLLLDKGCVEVHVNPTIKDSIATVTCFPASSWYEVDNSAVCHSDSAGPLRITRDWQHGSNRIIVTGNVTKPVVRKLSLQTSDQHFFTLFTERLLRSGIGSGEFGYGICPPEAQAIVTVDRPIYDVVHRALKKSDNLNAEALFYHLAAADGKPYATARDAVGKIDSLFAAIHKEYGPKELRLQPYKIVDGSGLSNYNMVSARHLLGVLRYAYGKQEIYAMLTESLPHSGIDGTLKGRMAAKVMRGRIVAKTGSMTGVSTLAGYAKARNGHTLAIVIMNQQVMKLSQARAWQDKVCETICVAGN